MAMNPSVFASAVFFPVLRRIGLFTPVAEQLLLGTAIQESGLSARRQVGGGPALGLYQMEPNTANDIWSNYLKFHAQLAYKIAGLLSSPTASKVNDLEYNDRYATAMARVKYARVSAPLPALNDIPAMALYWKQYYNTPLGAGSPDQFITNWDKALGVKTLGATVP